MAAVAVASIVLTAAGCSNDGVARRNCDGSASCPTTTVPPPTRSTPRPAATAPVATSAAVTNGPAATGEHRPAAVTVTGRIRVGGGPWPGMPMHGIATDIEAYGDSSDGPVTVGGRSAADGSFTLAVPPGTYVVAGRLGPSTQCASDPTVIDATHPVVITIDCAMA